MYKICSFLMIPLFCLVITLYVFSDGGAYSKEMLTGTICIVFISILLFIVSSFYDPIKQIRKQYIRPMYLFLIGYFIVFYQAYLDVLFGNIRENDLFFFYKSTLINKAALLSTIGLLALFLGYFLRVKKIKVKPEKLKYIPLKKLIIFFTIINLVSLAANIKTLLYGEYSQALLEEKAGSLGSYLELIFYVTYLSILIIHAINCRLVNVQSVRQFIKSLGLLFFINVGIFLLLVMLSGNRGPILTYSLTFICSLTIGTFYKLKFKYIFIAIISGSIFFSLLGIVRKMDTNKPFSDRLIEAYAGNGISEKYTSFSSGTAELSTSVRTLHYSMEYVPDKYPHLYGIIQLRESLKIIPFAAGIFDPLFPSHFRYKNSAFYITWLDKGEFYNVGTGSSIVADLYLSFGEIGVFLGMFLIGRLFRKADVYAFVINQEGISVFGAIVTIVLVGTSIGWSRATFLEPVQSIAFAYIMIRLIIWRNK